MRPDVLRSAKWFSVGLAALAAASLLPGTLSGEAKPPREIDPQELSFAPIPAMRDIRMQIGEHVYTLELALTPEQQRRGLMFRTELAPDRGMLFPYAPARVVSFWMKNTKIPLDMLFIHQGRVVHVVHNVPPCVDDPCPSYTSIVPVDMVVELSGGTARQAGIDMGARALVLDVADGNSTADSSSLHELMPLKPAD